MDFDRAAETTDQIEAGRGALHRFAGAGYARSEPAILQPTAPFLELLGEELKAKLLLTGEGGELCLRPEYTIPVCREHLSLAKPGARQVSYFGPVFRAGDAASREARQVGLESFGRPDKEAADAEILALALEGAALVAHHGLSVRMGDASLLNELLSLLRVGPRDARRIRRTLAKGGALATALKPRAASPIHGGVLAALEKSDHAGAKALVADLLAISGIKPLGGRPIAEIAERLLAKAESGAAEPLAGGRLAIIEKFLAIRGDPDEAAASLRAFAKDSKLDLGQALDRLDLRIGFIAARGLDVAKMTFATDFLREFDYYTGFLFDAGRDGATYVGGGRYDALAQALGGAAEVPAVGAAIWVGEPPKAGAQS